MIFFLILVLFLLLVLAGLRQHLDEGCLPCAVLAQKDCNLRCPEGSRLDGQLETSQLLIQLHGRGRT